MGFRKIINGALPDADDVNDNVNFMLDISAIAFINGLSTTNQQTIVDTALVVADTSATAWTYDEIASGFYGDVLVDQIDNSAIDATIWSNTGGGSVAEDTSKIDIVATNNTSHTLAADQASAPDFKTFSGDSKALLLVKRVKATGAWTATWTVKVGATTIHSIAVVSGTVALDETYVLWFDKAAETASLYTKDGALLTGSIDISGEANWSVEFFCGSVSGGATGTANYHIYSLSYTTESDATTPEITTASDTATVTTNAMFVHLTTNDDSLLVTVEVSADGGGNYVTSAQANLVNITNTGTALRVRVNASQPTALAESSAYEPMYLSAYCILYDAA